MLKNIIKFKKLLGVCLQLLFPWLLFNFCKKIKRWGCRISVVRCHSNRYLISICISKLITRNIIQGQCLYKKKVYFYFYHINHELIKAQNVLKMQCNLSETNNYVRKLRSEMNQTKVSHKILLVKSSGKYFIFLLVFYLIMWVWKLQRILEK